MPKQEQFNKRQSDLLRKIDDAVARRAQAVREQFETTQEIASLCSDARQAGVVMRVLSDHVRVLENPGTEEEAMRPITRQSLDGMLAKFDGRPRAPRRARRPGQGRHARNGSTPPRSGRINTSVFSQ